MAPDRLARPADFAAGYGAGARRAVVLGGGGVFFVAWQVAYLHRLVELGVDVDAADVVVGTSAGSLVGAVVARRRVGRLATQVGLLARVPPLLGALAPASGLSASQLRALDLFRTAVDADPATVRAIGHAALAARTPAASVMQRNTALVVGTGCWASAALRVVAVDAFTGERLVVTASSGVRTARAVAASSAVPGLFAPQPLLDRFAMDGGVSGSGTHLDLVAGADRALVISLLGRVLVEEPGMTVGPRALLDEAAALEAAGTTVLVRAPRLPADVDLMAAAGVPAALALGERQAEEDAAEVAAFWRG